MKNSTPLLTLVLATFVSLPANAFLDGDTIDIRYLFPDTDTVFVASNDIVIGAGLELDCPGGGVCTVNFDNVFLDFVDIDPDADTMTIDWNGGAGFFIRDFNGFEVSRLDERIGAVSVQCTRLNGTPCEPEVTFGTNATLGNYLRVNYGELGVSVDAVSTTVTISPCTESADTDADGILDSVDNCLLAANPDQVDADGDGFGNVCDQDINNDSVVNVLDLGLLRAAFFSNPASGNWEPGADFNSDNIINVIDLGRLRASFFDAPGPSCALGMQGRPAP